MVGYFSPPGHDHDDNCTLRDYVCTGPEKHGITLSKRRSCSVNGCGWKGKDACFCHKPEQKIDLWPEEEEDAK